MNVLSLFDGISIGRLALDKIGIDCSYYSSEVDKYAIEISNNNYPDIIRLGDVTEIDENKLKELPKIDLLIGGSPCFIAGTLVMTTKGYKNIEDIVEGDEVLTHTNNFKKVKLTMKKYTNILNKVKTMACKETFVTPEHPFYVRKKYFKNKKRCFGDPEWVRAVDLTKDYYVSIAINNNSNIPQWNGIETRVNNSSVIVKNELNKYMSVKNFWWIVGRYIGDGWTVIHKRKNRNNSYIYKTIICCSKNGNELNDILEKLEGIFNYTVVEDRTAYKVQISNQELYCYLQQFGKYAHGKKITGDIFNLPKELLRAFVEGYVSADGCIKNNKFKITTVSKELAYGMGQCVAKAYESPFSISKTKRPDRCTIEGREVNQRDTYDIYFNTTKNEKDTAFYENGYIWCKFNSIENVEYDGYVYNMEVVDDNSYTANNMIVHNCQGFSRQGKCLNFEDARSKLFFEYIRILKWLRNNNNPNIKFMLENVHMKKEWENTITEYIGVESKDINSKLVSAQNRPRLYWTNICIDDITDKNIKLLDILEYVDTSEYINHQGLKIDPSINKKALNIINVVDGEVRISQATKKGYIIAENGDGVNLGFPNSKSRRGRVVKQKSSTLDCGCDVCVYYDGIIRKLTISELEKLQTLPVGYTEGVSEARRKHAIGNGWTTDVIVHILKDLK